jgi:hypothetical protein
LRAKASAPAHCRMFYRFARRRAAEIRPTAPAPKAQNMPLELPPGAAEHEILPVAVPWPLHVPPSHAEEPVVVTVAVMCAVRTLFSATMQPCTSEVLTYWPLQTMAPVCWHCVVQSLASSVLQVWMLLSWHWAWQFKFAVAVHDPVQSAVHLVAQTAVVGTATHCVVQWSSQHAPQDAWQSADADAETDPSTTEDDALAVHDALQPPLQRVWQSVEQSKVGGLVAQLVAQSVEQVATQVTSADVVHCALQLCSSLAAHACSQLAGAH